MDARCSIQMYVAFRSETFDEICLEREGAMGNVGRRGFGLEDMYYKPNLTYRRPVFRLAPRNLCMQFRLQRLVRASIHLPLLLHCFVPPSVSLSFSLLLLFLFPPLLLSPFCFFALFRAAQVTGIGLVIITALLQYGSFERPSVAFPSFLDFLIRSFLPGGGSYVPYHYRNLPFLTTA